MGIEAVSKIERVQKPRKLQTEVFLNDKFLTRQEKEEQQPFSQKRKKFHQQLVKGSKNKLASEKKERVQPIIQDNSSCRNEQDMAIRSQVKIVSMDMIK